MKIEFSNGIKKCRFDELKPGDCFRFDDFVKPSKEVYMRTDSSECMSVVELDSGVLDGNFRDDAEVILLDATIVVK